AAAQGFSTNIWDLIIIRFLLGIPLGSDIANGYAYIMESMSKGTREKMGTRWQFMFGLGEVFAILVITLMYIAGIDHSVLWRVGLADGAVPAPPRPVREGQGDVAEAVRRSTGDVAERGRAPGEGEGQRLPQGHLG